MANESMDIRYLTTPHLEDVKEQCRYMINSLMYRNFGPRANAGHQKIAETLFKGNECDSIVTRNIAALRSLRTLVIQMLDTLNKRPLDLQTEKAEEERRQEALRVSEKPFEFMFVVGEGPVQLRIVEDGSTAVGKVLWFSENLESALSHHDFGFCNNVDPEEAAAFWKLNENDTPECVASRARMLWDGVAHMIDIIESAEGRKLRARGERQATRALQGKNYVLKIVLGAPMLKMVSWAKITTEMPYRYGLSTSVDDLREMETRARAEVRETARELKAAHPTLLMDARYTEPNVSLEGEDETLWLRNRSANARILAIRTEISSRDDTPKRE
ncbi:hypothetical protein DFP73DRAFT_592013 [Morchella snyderi]|nr:hypothetical protein DFP73DRAFT_592013 [Morchella snyderi]